GYAQEILALSRRQIPIIGICGGYQMLGMKISDPLGVEAESGGPGSGMETEGLGLLNTVTVFLPEKTTERVEGEVLGTAGFLGQIESREVRGYEIHMGTTVRLPGAAPLLHWRRRGQQEVDYPEGAVDPSGLVMGTYLHDLFENDGFRVAFVNWLRRRRGLAPVPPSALIPPSLECNPVAPEVDPARDRGGRSPSFVRSGPQGAAVRPAGQPGARQPGYELHLPAAQVTAHELKAGIAPAPPNPGQ
ncbi:MAG: hypothetical protein IMW99_11285, partial [Firmicutes bacterium]|nr:hypothetical protein [Bacillota bacterium]